MRTKSAITVCRRRDLPAVENSRYSVTQVGDDDSPQVADNTWMLSYLDVLTLLIAFFVLLLAMSEPKSDDEQILRSMASEGATPTAEANAIAVRTSRDGVLDGSVGVLPEHNAILADSDGQTQLDEDGSGPPDNTDTYDEHFSDLENSFNALSLQGVDATPGREGLTLRIADNLLFASGDSELSYDGMLLISQLRPVLQAFDGEISVEGHTDNIPINTMRFPSNWELSSARAISVLRFLESDGMDTQRMRAVGYSDTKPLQDNTDAPGRAANRRVEIILREPTNR